MRLTQIDTAKFIAIFFVIVSHCSMTSPISSFLFAFHVQLFFLCYGYVYKDKGGLRQFLNLHSGGVKVLIYRLLIPFGLLFLIFGPPLSVSSLIRIFYGRTAGLSGTAHLWFLPCFFLSAILFNVVSIASRKKRYVRIVLFACIAFISSTLDYDSNIYLNVGNKVIHLTGYGVSDKVNLYWGFPYTANVALTGGVLMYIGESLRKVFDRFDVLNKKVIYIAVGIASFMLGVLGYVINQNFVTNDFAYHIITMSHAIYGNYILFLSTSICLSVFTICLACLIDNKVTSKFGKTTMEIYAFHPFVMSIAGILMCRLHIPDIGCIVLSILTLMMCCLIVPIIRKIDPAIVGVISNKK